jgi:HSP20 family protein
MKGQLAVAPAKQQVAIMRPTAVSELWQDFDEVYNTIQKRAFQLFECRGFENGHDMCDWSRAENEFLKAVTLELKEKDNNLIIRADVPGFEARELEVNLEGDTFTLRGKKVVETEKKEKEKTLYSECRSEQIYRTMTLPSNVIAEKAVATLKDGVLEITIPKAVQSKRIEVQAA